MSTEDEDILRRLAERDRVLAEHRARLPPEPDEPAALERLIELPPGVDRASCSARRREHDEELLRRDNAKLAKERSERAMLCVPPKLRPVATGAEPARETAASVGALAWESTSRRGLILAGSVGTGKSQAAAMALGAHVRRGRLSVSWHRPDEFVTGMLHAYADDAPTVGSHMVVIDDIGRATKPQFEEALCAFIDSTDARFILTTDIRTSDLKNRYDVRTLDRLRETCKAVTSSGESLRKAR